MQRTSLYLAVVCVACGGGSSATTDAALVSDAQPDGSVAGPAGAVSITRLANGQFIASAAFANGLSPDPFGCVGATRQVGSCCYIPPSSAPPDHAMYASAGTVTLRSETLATDLATLEPDPSTHSYFSYQWNTPDWHGGDMIHAVAVGDAFPAFAVTARAPAVISGTSPVWDHDHDLHVALGQDLVVAWQPDSASTSKMTLLMLAEQNGGTFPSHGSVLCTVDDAAGKVTVDKSLLTDFQPGDLCALCGLQRASRASMTTSAGAAWLSLFAIGGGGGSFQ